MQNRLLAAILFILISVYAYRPALDRVFIGDQISYFAELHGQTSLSTGLHHYDYAVSRQYWKGDDALFRPLSMAWLAVGNSLFSYHHVWWNVASLTLHVLVIFFLFELLLQIRPSNFALPVAALFAVMMPTLELVVWDHLGGYLLAYLFFVVGFRAIVRIVTSEKPASRASIAVYVFAFTLSGFFHETMVVVSLIAGVALCVVWKRQGAFTLQRALAVFLPVLAFASLYAFHIFRAERILFVDRAANSQPFEAGTVLAIPARTLLVITRWTGDILLPAAVTYRVPPFARLNSTLKFSWVTPGHLVNAAVAAALLWLLWRAVSYSRASRNLPLTIVLVGAMFAHIGVISLGRGQSEVLGTTYYRYFFSLLALVLVYVLADFDGVRLLWLPLLALFVFHLVGTRRTTRQIEWVNEEPSAYLTRIGTFVDEHKAESGFSFVVERASFEVDPLFLLVEGYPDAADRSEKRLPLSQILFAPYYNTQNAPYVLVWDGSNLSVNR